MGKDDYGKLAFYDFDADDEEDAEKIKKAAEGINITDKEYNTYSEEELDPLAGEKMRMAIIAGIFIMAVPFAVLGMFWSGSRFIFLSGLIVGTIISTGLINHMYKTLLTACEYDEDSAKKFSRNKTVKRMFFCALVLILAGIFTDIAFVFGILVGMLCLKFSAYIQPLTYKYVSKKFVRKGR